jgi:hypothetical protein
LQHAIHYIAKSNIDYSFIKGGDSSNMNENPNDASNPQGREREAGQARPINPFLSGRLGRLTGIGTSSPYRQASSSGELVTFLILFALLAGTGVGIAIQSFLVGVGTFLAIIVLVIGSTILIKQIKKPKNQP